MTIINQQLAVWGLEELASREEQERLWLANGSTDEMSSFEEVICSVFDDSGVSRALDSGKLSAQLADKFRSLSKLIDKVPQNVPPQQQIDHPAMKAISEIALELKEMLTKEN